MLVIAAQVPNQTPGRGKPTSGERREQAPETKKGMMTACSVTAVATALSTSLTSLIFRRF